MTESPQDQLRRLTSASRVPYLPAIPLTNFPAMLKYIIGNIVRNVRKIEDTRTV